MKLITPGKKKIHPWPWSAATCVSYRDANHRSPAGHLIPPPALSCSQGAKQSHKPKLVAHRSLPKRPGSVSGKTVWPQLTGEKCTTMYRPVFVLCDLPNGRQDRLRWRGKNGRQMEAYTSMKESCQPKCYNYDTENAELLRIQKLISFPCFLKNENFMSCFDPKNIFNIFTFLFPLIIAVSSLLFSIHHFVDWRFFSLYQWTYVSKQWFSLHSVTSRYKDTCKNHNSCLSTLLVSAWH